MDNDGALAPPYVINASDKRGLVVVIAATTLSFVWTCLLIRIYLRLKLREWKLDDYLLVAATVSSLLQVLLCAARDAAASHELLYSAVCRVGTTPPSIPRVSDR